jgi:hypothetical protein
MIKHLREFALELIFDGNSKWLLRAQNLRTVEMSTLVYLWSQVETGEQ